MTETIIAVLLVSGGVYLVRLFRRGWHRVRGMDPPQAGGPLPIVRVVKYIREVAGRALSQVRGQASEQQATGPEPAKELATRPRRRLDRVVKLVTAVGLAGGAAYLLVLRRLAVADHGRQGPEGPGEK